MASCWTFSVALVVRRNQNTDLRRTQIRAFRCEGFDLNVSMGFLSIWFTRCQLRRTLSRVALHSSAIQTVGEGKEPAGGAWGAEREGLPGRSIKQVFCIADGRMWQGPLTTGSVRRHKRTVARRADPILLRQTIRTLTGEPARCSKESGNCFPTSGFWPAPGPGPPGPVPTLRG